MSCTCEVHDTTTLSALHLSLHDKVQEIPLFFQWFPWVLAQTCMHPHHIHYTFLPVHFIRACLSYPIHYTLPPVCTVHFNQSMCTPFLQCSSCAWNLAHTWVPPTPHHSTFQPAVQFLPISSVSDLHAFYTVCTTPSYQCTSYVWILTRLAYLPKHTLHVPMYAILDTSVWLLHELCQLTLRNLAERQPETNVISWLILHIYVANT